MSPSTPPRVELLITTSQRSRTSSLIRAYTSGLQVAASSSGRRACRAAILAPSPTHSATWSAISSGCVGRCGLCCLVAIPPVGATVMMTLRGATCAVVVSGMTVPSASGASSPTLATDQSLVKDDFVPKSRPLGLDVEQGLRVEMADLGAVRFAERCGRQERGCLIHGLKRVVGAEQDVFRAQRQQGAEQRSGR